MESVGVVEVDLLVILRLVVVLDDFFVAGLALLPSSSAPLSSSLLSLGLCKWTGAIKAWDANGESRDVVVGSGGGDVVVVGGGGVVDRDDAVDACGFVVDVGLLLITTSCRRNGSGSKFRRSLGSDNDADNIEDGVRGALGNVAASLAAAAAFAVVTLSFLIS